MKKLVLALAMVAAMAVTASAAVTVTQDLTGTVNNDYATVFAINFGGPSGNFGGIYYNGVAKESNQLNLNDVITDGSANNEAIFKNDVTITYDTAGSGLFDTSANLADYKMNHIYINGKINGVDIYDPAKSYLVQYIVGDDFDVYTGYDTQPNNWIMELTMDSGSDSYGYRGGPGSNTVYGIVVQDMSQPVPEPATMALLGLGGLFIRRRKKA